MCPVGFGRSAVVNYKRWRSVSPACVFLRSLFDYLFVWIGLLRYFMNALVLLLLGLVLRGKLGFAIVNTHSAHSWTNVTKNMPYLSSDGI